jgi:PAS domain-containing protein
VDDKTAKYVSHAYSEIYRTGIPGKNIVYDIIRKDGTRRTVEATVSLIQDEDGKITGFRSVNRDITERQKAEKELSEHRVQLEAIFRSVKDAIIILDLMHVIARAVAAANSVDAKVVRQNISKVLPALGDKYPSEFYNIQDDGVINNGVTMQYVIGGKFSRVDCVLTFPQTQKEYEKFKKMSKLADTSLVRWAPIH